MFPRCRCASGSSRVRARLRRTKNAPQGAAAVLLVGTYQGQAGELLDDPGGRRRRPAERLGAVAPGDYHEHYDTAHGATGDDAFGCVDHEGRRAPPRNGSQRRGRSTGPRPAPRSAAGRLPIRTSGPSTGRAGLRAAMASRSGRRAGVTIDNLTVCNFLTGAHGGGNQIWWNGGDGSGKIGLHAYNGSYLSATSTYAGDDADGSYGIFVSNSDGPGVIAHTYASNMSDSGYYIGACPGLQRDARRRRTRSTRRSGTRGRTPAVTSSSRTASSTTTRPGFSTNSQNNDDAPSPQDGRCPKSGIGPTGTRSCWIFEHNYVHDNNNANVPGHGSAELGPPGTGLVISGGRYDTVVDNRFENNGSWAVLRRAVPRHRYSPADRPLRGWRSPRRSRRSGSRVATSIRGATTSRTTRSRTTAVSATPRTAISARSRRSTRPATAGTRTPIPTASPPRPRSLQKTNGTCGAAHAGAQLGSTLTAQVICATEVFGPCPPKPGDGLPATDEDRPPRAHSPADDADPCAGVPANAVVHEGRTRTAAIVPVALLAVSLAPVRRRVVRPIR